MAEQQKEDFRYIVRIADTDLAGNKNIFYALTKIKGIGTAFASMVMRKSGVDPAKKLGTASEEEVKRINSAIADLVKTAPPWMMNRRLDPEDGSSRHLLTAQLTFTRDNDVKLMRKIKTYKGSRHSRGLPVRGQRTKSNFRKNKGQALGVAKKKVEAPAGKGAEKGGGGKK